MLFVISTPLYPCVIFYGIIFTFRSFHFRYSNVEKGNVVAETNFAGLGSNWKFSRNLSTENCVLKK